MLYLCVCGFFEKKQDFVLFLRKTEKTHSEVFLLHHPMSPFSELHNNNLLYIIMAFKIEGKEMYPIFALAGVVGQFTPKAWQACAQQTEKNIPTQTLQFHVKFMCMPCWFSIYKVYFFNI